MTNFHDLKPYIDKKSILPSKPAIDKTKAIKEAIKIIRENKKIIEAAQKSSNENPHR